MSEQNSCPTASRHPRGHRGVGARQRLRPPADLSARHPSARLAGAQDVDAEDRRCRRPSLPVHDATRQLRAPRSACASDAPHGGVSRLESRGATDSGGPSRLHRLGARPRRAADDRGAHPRCLDAPAVENRPPVWLRCDPRRLRGAAVSVARRHRRRRCRPASLSRRGRTPRRRRRGASPPRPRNLHPRVPVPAAGVHRQSRQLSGHALSRRHPERHGTGDRGGRDRVGLATAAQAGRLVAAYAALACACAMVTPIVRTPRLVDALPTWVQWYLRPCGRLHDVHAVSLGRIRLCGRGCGVLLEHARDARAERRVLTVVRGRGRGACSSSGFVTAAPPSIYAQSSFWTSSPTYFAIRVGILMLGLAALVVRWRRRWNARGVRWPVAGAARAELAVRLLDPRRAGVRLRHLASPPSPSALGHCVAFALFSLPDVRRRRRPGSRVEGWRRDSSTRRARSVYARR